jgi:peptide/nickel transport system substrate-binding protein
MTENSDSLRKMSRREMLRLTALAGAGVLAAGCTVVVPTPAAGGATAGATVAAPSEAGAAQAGGSIIAGMVGDLTNLDPFVMGFNNYPMMENVYDQFVRLNNEVQPSPGAIEEWEPSPDGTKLTLKLRNGITYHDGSTATAEDVVECIKRAGNSETGSNQFPNWQSVQDVSATGNDTIEVTFEKSAAYIIPAMGFISLIRPPAFETLKSEEGGSGPFRVKEWVPGDYLDLERFEDYWDTGLPVADTARVKFFDDDAAMVAALEAGTIDVALSLPPREYDRLKDRFNIVRGQDAANFYYLGMNPTMPPFDKKEVRYAMAHALDKATITSNVLYGISDPISIPWPEFSLAYSPDFEGMYPYDLEKARQLLVDAGYPDGFEFSIAVTNTFPEFSQFAEVFKASLAEIGCTVNIEPMDIAQWVPVLIEAKYGAIFSFAGGTQWFPTRITLSANFAINENPVWPDGIPPAAYAEGISRTDASFDVEEQKAGMNQAVTSFMEEMWVAPIAFRYSLFAQQPNVEGFSYGVYDQPRLYRAVAKK